MSETAPDNAASSGSPAAPAPSAPTSPSGGGSAEASVARASQTLSAASSPAQPQPAGQPPVQPTTQAPAAAPPQQRWESILRNARAEAQRAVYDQLGMSREELQNVLFWHRQLRQDPRAFAKQLAQEIGDDQEPQFEYPDPDLETPDKSKKVYSADAVQKFVQTAVNQARHQLMQELNPTIQFAQRGQQEAQEAAVRQEASKVADNAFRQISNLPHFQENKAEIARLMASATPEQRRAMGGSIALMYAAYNKVLADKVFPTLRQKVEQDVISGFRRSASAGGSVTPAPASGNQQPKVRDGNVDDIAKLMAAKAEQLSR